MCLQWRWSRVKIFRSSNYQGMWSCECSVVQQHVIAVMSCRCEMMTGDTCGVFCFSFKIQLKRKQIFVIYFVIPLVFICDFTVTGWSWYRQGVDISKRHCKSKVIMNLQWHYDMINEYLERMIKLSYHTYRSYACNIWCTSMFNAYDAIHWWYIQC